MSGPLLIVADVLAMPAEPYGPCESGGFRGLLDNPGMLICCCGFFGPDRSRGGAATGGEKPLPGVTGEQPPVFAPVGASLRAGNGKALPGVST